MPLSEEHNRIDDLNRSLYSRNAPDVRTRRRFRFSGQVSDVKDSWQKEPEPDEPVVLNQAYEDHSMSFLTKILIASAVFCVIAVGTGAYLFLNGANFISANNIDIAINGPVSIAAGTPISLDITVTNKNNVALQTADLSVVFPAGTTDPADPSSSLQQIQETIGDIPAGGSATKTVSAVIFGEENLQKEIAVTVTYGITGSSAVFTKTQSYDVLIDSSPATLSVTSFKQITSGQAFDMTVDFKSNSASTLKAVLVKATYPFGYSFTSSSIAPSASDNATWLLGDVPAGQDRSFVIHGTLSGEDSDVRAFHFSAGTQDPDSPSDIGTAYADTEQDVSIQKSFISLGLTMGSDSSLNDYVAQPGSSVQVQIPWQNNVPETLTDVVITADLSGSAYSASQVSPNGGYFNSANNEIIWSQQTDPELASVAAGGSGTLSFSLTPLAGASDGTQIIDPEVTISASASADRTQETGVSGQTTAVVRNIKVSPAVSLSGRIVRAAGPFLSSGPIPPVVDQSTTYTVVWTVDNTSSSVSGAQVTATLPPYVSWLGNVSPSTETVTYDQPSGTVTWNVGAVSTYTSGTSDRRSVAFQVSFQPSADQVGTAPTLIDQATLTATDDWTGASLNDAQGSLTTSFSTDPSFQSGDEIVGKGD